MLGLLAGPANAQTVAIDELRPLRPNAVVQIDVVEHTVTVTGWDRDEIRISGEYDSRFERLQIGGDDSRFRFQIQHSDRGRIRRSGSELLEINVPRGVRLSVETVSGSLDVDGLTGELVGESVSGNVDVTGDLTTVSLESVSGAVRYRGDAPIVRLESVSGSADFEGSAREVRMESVSGSVEMRGDAETVEAETVSGQAWIESGTPLRFLQIGSVSGGVRFEGGLAPSGRIDAESHSGTVEIRLTAGSGAEFDFSTFSGSVIADLPNRQDEVRSDGRGPGRSLRFSTGSGAGRVRASSFSGSVRISGR
jgi:DUF4097 and DUF4098 domain-containing protein YvlB